MTSGRVMDLGIAVAAVGALLYAVCLVPAGNRLVTPGGGEPPTTCWFHEVTGIDCPTCGMTRSYVALLHGDVLGSFRWHPAGPLMVLCSVLAVAVIAWSGIRRRRPLWDRRAFRAALHGLALVVLAAGLARYFL